MDENLKKVHQHFAATCFNKTWEYLDMTERTADDDLQMIHLAHASRWHWGQIGEPLQWARGEWQISRVYSSANKPEPSLFHANKSLRYCTEHNLGAFDTAFAYEAVARAYYIAGNMEKAQEFVKLAKKHAEKIEKEDDKNYLLGDLESIK